MKPILIALAAAALLAPVAVSLANTAAKPAAAPTIAAAPAKPVRVKTTIAGPTFQVEAPKLQVEAAPATSCAKVRVVHAGYGEPQKRC